MAGVEQQIPGFCFFAAYDDGATGDPQSAGVLNSEFRERPCRNGLLETMKTFVIKEFLSFNGAPPSVKKWRRDKKIQRGNVSKVRFTCPGLC